jgi:phage terminase large subunit GpA-like protein
VTELLELPRRLAPEALEAWRTARREIASAAFAPRSMLTLSQWADEKRYLSADLGEPGPWRTDRVPYMRRIMDAVTDPRVRRVSVIKPTRIGATQSIVLNAIGYYVDQEPSPIIVALPTIDDAKKFSTQLLDPMFLDTPCLEGKLEAVKLRRGRSTMLQKSFPGGTVQIIGTKSPRAMRMVHGRIILMSEIDAYELSAGTEGDPTKILPKRAGAYGNPKFVEESSPLLFDTSRIEPAFEAGSMEYFNVPCPHCGELQRLEWGGRDVRYGVKWDKDDPETAHYVCRLCGAVIDESLKFGMIARGQWIATHPGRRDHLSFHLNSLVSPFDGARWPVLVREWLDTKRKPELLQVFVNTVLGETFRLKGESVDANDLINRHETYPAQVPAGVGKLVRTVDVHDDRLEMLIVGFGEGEELWPIEHEIIEGDPGIPYRKIADPETPSPWNELATMLDREYVHEGGAKITPAITGIDLGGHHTKNVYGFAREFASRRVFALQGSNLGAGVPLVSKKKYSNTGKAFFYTLGVFTAKEAIVARLKKLTDPGPGCIHIPDWMDREHIEQLTAEELVTKREGGKVERVWQKRRERNEFLDLTVYAFCMLHALGIGVVRMLGDSAKDLLAEGAKAKAETEAAERADPSADSPAPDPEPTEDRGPYGLRERRNPGGWSRRY